MACTNDGYPPSQYEILTSKMPAVLCGIIRALSTPQRRAVLSRVNWKEVGVTEAEFAEWWTQHLAIDNERIAREKREALKTDAKAKALQKLTPAERKALGY